MAYQLNENEIFHPSAGDIVFEHLGTRSWESHVSTKFYDNALKELQKINENAEPIGFVIPFDGGNNDITDGDGNNPIIGITYFECWKEWAIPYRRLSGGEKWLFKVHALQDGQRYAVTLKGADLEITHGQKVFVDKSTGLFTNDTSGIAVPNCRFVANSNLPVQGSLKFNYENGTFGAIIECMKGY